MVDDDAALPVSHIGEDEAGELSEELGFASEVQRLTLRIREARDSRSPDELELLLQDLETAAEELRVADEEVRAQHEHVARLLRGDELMRWRYERMMGNLPVPVVTTDTHGRIRAVNATAAALFGVRIDQLLRKPLFVFVQDVDRSRLRDTLSALRRGEPTEVCRVTLRLRAHDIAVAASPSRAPISPEEVIWLVQPLTGGGAQAAGTGMLAGAVLALSALPSRSENAQTVIQHGADLCAQVLAPGCHVSVCLGSPTEPTAVASNDTEAQMLDRWQIEQAAGPSVSCYSWRTSVTTTDLTADERWSGPGSPQGELHVGVVAAPLLREQEVAGVLTVSLADGSRAENPQVVETVEVFGAAVGSVIQELGLRTQVEDLMSDMRTALESRAVIDQAKGIVMAHKHCSADEAFQHLVTLSNTSRVKLREVALRLVEQSGG
jgi:PAS domain S-box-containing protein